MRWLIGSLAVIGFALPGWGQPVSEYDMKATYLYNFANYVEWPEFDNERFNLCVWGDESLWYALKRLEGKRVGRQQLVIARLASRAAIHKCQLIFVSERESASLPQVAAALGNDPVLIVTDAPAGAIAAVTLQLDGERLVFDVNIEVCKRAGLKPSSTLLRLARQVRKTAP